MGGGVQTERARHGEDWLGGSDAIEGTADIPIDLLLLAGICYGKLMLCLGPQDGSAAAVAQCW